MKKSESFYTRAFKSVLKDPLSLTGFLIVIVFIVTSLLIYFFGESILPYNPKEMALSEALKMPSMKHLFGTDRYGRDLFSRVLAAMPTDVAVSFLVIASAVIIGLALGTISGYLGGMIDEVIMRITDMFLAFPAIILAIAIAVSIGPGVINAAIALITTWWPTYVRLARAETLRIKGLEFIEAAKVSRLSTIKIIMKHIIPNILPTIIAYATFDMGGVVLSYAGLSYFGLGAQPPQPEWGSDVFAGQDYLTVAPWWPLFPGLAIVLLAIGFALLGDGLRDAFSREYISK